MFALLRQRLFAMLAFSIAITPALIACSGGGSNSGSANRANVSAVGLSAQAQEKVQQVNLALNEDPNYALTQSDLDALRESGAMAEGDAPAVGLLVKR